MVIGDGERIAVFAVAEHEFPLVVGAPQAVGGMGMAQGRALGLVAAALAALDQVIAIQHRVYPPSGVERSTLPALSRGSCELATDNDNRLDI